MAIKSSECAAFSLILHSGLRFVETAAAADSVIAICARAPLHASPPAVFEKARLVRWLALIKRG